MICLLVSLSLHKAEAAIQRLASLVEDRKGKQVPVELEKTSKAEKR